MRRSKSAHGTAQARLVSSDSHAALPAAVRCGPRGFGVCSNPILGRRRRQRGYKPRLPRCSSSLRSNRCGAVRVNRLHAVGGRPIRAIDAGCGRRREDARCAVPGKPRAVPGKAREGGGCSHQRSPARSHAPAFRPRSGPSRHWQLGRHSAWNVPLSRQGRRRGCCAQGFPRRSRTQRRCARPNSAGSARGIEVAP